MTRTEWEAAGSTSPLVKVWGESGGEAASSYARTFRLSPGQHVLVRLVDHHEAAELYAVTSGGLKRLQVGARS